MLHLDSGIDIFIESEDGDEYYYDVIQAKYSKLTEEEIRGCFLNMKESIKQYLKILIMFKIIWNM